MSYTDPSTIANPGALIDLRSGGGADITFSGKKEHMGIVFNASRKGSNGGITTVTCFQREMTRDERKGGNSTYTSGILMLTAVASLQFNDHRTGTTSHVVIGGGRDDADDSGVRTAGDVG